MPHVFGVSYFSSKGPTGDGRRSQTSWHRGRRSSRRRAAGKRDGRCSQARRRRRRGTAGVPGAGGRRSRGGRVVVARPRRHSGGPATAAAQNTGTAASKPATAAVALYREDSGTSMAHRTLRCDRCVPVDPQGVHRAAGGRQAHLSRNGNRSQARRQLSRPADGRSHAGHPVGLSQGDPPRGSPKRSSHEDTSRVPVLRGPCSTPRADSSTPPSSPTHRASSRRGPRASRIYSRSPRLEQQYEGGATCTIGSSPTSGPSSTGGRSWRRVSDLRDRRGAVALQAVRGCGPDSGRRRERGAPRGAAGWAAARRARDRATRPAAPATSSSAETDRRPQGLSRAPPRRARSLTRRSS